MRRNFRQQNLTRPKTPYFLLKSSKALKMPYFIYLKNRRKFNTFRRKLELTPFFAEFQEFQGETTYQLGSYTLH